MDKEIKAALEEFVATADNLLGNKIVADIKLTEGNFRDFHALRYRI